MITSHDRKFWSDHMSTVWLILPNAFCNSMSVSKFDNLMYKLNSQPTSFSTVENVQLPHFYNLLVDGCVMWDVAVSKSSWHKRRSAQNSGHSMTFKDYVE